MLKDQSQNQISQKEEKGQKSITLFKKKETEQKNFNPIIGDSSEKKNYTGNQTVTTSTQFDREKLGQELITAAKNGDLEKVKDLVLRGADINIVGKEERKEIVRRRPGRSYNAYYHEAPLHYAIERNNIEMVEFLVKKGADIYQERIHKRHVNDYTPEPYWTIPKGQTPLDIARQKGNQEIITLLEKAVGIETKSNVSPSKNSSSLPRRVRAISPLRKPSRVIRDMSPKRRELGRQLAHSLVNSENPDLEKINQLIESEDNVNVTPTKELGNNSKDGIVIQQEQVINTITPIEEKEKLGQELITAAKNGDLEKVKDLIIRGANIDARDDVGYTSLSLAKDLEILKILIENGANVNADIYDHYDEHFTPLLSATYQENVDPVEIVKLLLEKGAEINVQECNGLTPLMLAITNRQKETAKLLINNKADLEIRNKFGVAALQLSLITKDNDTEAEIPKMLIDAGADIHAKNGHGWTALMWAVSSGHIKIVDILLKKGVDIEEKNNNGKTALDIAKEKGNQEIITLLENAEKLENAALIVQKRYRAKKIWEKYQPMLQEQREKRQEREKENQKRMELLELEAKVLAAQVTTDTEKNQEKLTNKEAEKIKETYVNQIKEEIKEKVEEETSIIMESLKLDSNDEIEQDKKLDLDNQNITLFVSEIVSDNKQSEIRDLEIGFIPTVAKIEEVEKKEKERLKTKLEKKRSARSQMEAQLKILQKELSEEKRKQKEELRKELEQQKQQNISPEKQLQILTKRVDNLEKLTNNDGGNNKISELERKVASFTQQLEVNSYQIGQLTNQSEANDLLMNYQKRLVGKPESQQFYNLFRMELNAELNKANLSASKHDTYNVDNKYTKAANFVGIGNEIINNSPIASIVSNLVGAQLLMQGTHKGLLHVGNKVEKPRIEKMATLAIGSSACESLSCHISKLLTETYEEQLSCLDQNGIRIFAGCVVADIVQMFKSKFSTFNPNDSHEVIADKVMDMLANPTKQKGIKAEQKSSGTELSTKVPEARKWRSEELLNKTGVKLKDDKLENIYYHKLDQNPNIYGYRKTAMDLNQLSAQNYQNDPTRLGPKSILEKEQLAITGSQATQTVNTASSQPQPVVGSATQILTNSIPLGLNMADSNIQTMFTQLLAKVDELSKQVTVLTEEDKELRKQVTVLTEENKELRSQLANKRDKSPTPAIPATPTQSNGHKQTGSFRERMQKFESNNKQPSQQTPNTTRSHVERHATKIQNNNLPGFN